MSKFDIKTMSDKAFYGERWVSTGYYQKTVDNAQAAANKVTASILDNSKDGEKRYGRVAHFESVSIDALEVGDLIAYADLSQHRGSYASRPGDSWDVSVAEWVSSGRGYTHLAIVMKKTAKRVVVKGTGNPGYHFENDFSFEADRHEETFGDSYKRFIVRLGNRDALVKAAQESEAYGRWERTHAAALAARDEHNRRYRAQIKADQAAEEAAIAPYKPVVKAMNAALGYKVFQYTTTGVERRRGWEKVPTSFLKQALLVDDSEVLALLDKHAVVGG